MPFFPCVAQESPLHGYGLFAQEDLGTDYIGVPLEGSFEVFHNVDDAVERVYNDGIPRYGVCNTDALRKLCLGNEGLRDKAALYLKPDPCSPWFYLNTMSTADSRRVEELNVLPDIVFSSRTIRASDTNIYDTLKDPANGIVLKLSQHVCKGGELLVDYPLGDVGEQSGNVADG